jgi:hypothetical protein
MPWRPPPPLAALRITGVAELAGHSQAFIGVPQRFAAAAQHGDTHPLSQIANVLSPSCSRASIEGPTKMIPALWTPEQARGFPT